MSNFLVRGIPPRLYREMQNWAETENLSLNQLFVRFVHEAVEARKKANKVEEEKKDVFQRIEEMREAIYKRHGLLKDSTRFIREDRDSH